LFFVSFLLSSPSSFSLLRPLSPLSPFLLIFLFWKMKNFFLLHFEETMMVVVGVRVEVGVEREKEVGVEREGEG
jgi:ABC-type Mn2+/Zn2+ transport system permease subunit